MSKGLFVRDLKVGNEKATVLNDISIDLSSGKAMGLVGPSGAGKTMLARAILGLLPESYAIISGEIILDDLNLVTCQESKRRHIRGRRIGYMVQNPSSALDPTASIRSQFVSTLESHGIDPSRKPVWKEVRYWLTRVGFQDPDEIMNRYPFQLSGGMAKRVYLAMLSLLEPDYLIVDEPTAGLDVTTSRSIMHILFGMQQRCTIVMITHDVRLLVGQVEHMAVMHNGRIVEEGTMDQLFQQPEHEITESLLRPLHTERPV